VPAEDLVAVELRALPVALFVRATEHTDGLLREFALIQADPASAPGRVLALSMETRERFREFTAAPSSSLAAAVERGDAAVDLVYHVPRAAGEASRRLDAILDEAGEYCRTEQLLTVDAPDDVVAFRRWFLGEFVAQIGGAPPTPWPEWIAADRPVSG
jgi:hypothetical protein